MRVEQGINAVTPGLMLKGPSPGGSVRTPLRMARLTAALQRRQRQIPEAPLDDAHLPCR
jgi:hypothetical protein